jgi:hypothetical protein
MEQHPTQIVLEIQGEAAQAAQLLKHLVTGGVDVVKFARRIATLEDRYQRAFGGKPR